VLEVYFRQCSVLVYRARTSAVMAETLAQSRRQSVTGEQVMTHYRNLAGRLRMTSSRHVRLRRANGYYRRSGLSPARAASAAASWRRCPARARARQLLATSRQGTDNSVRGIKVCEALSRHTI